MEEYTQIILLLNIHYVEIFKLLFMITYSGDGSEKKLPNGNGEETYYSPSERRNVLNQTLDFGVEYMVKKTSLRLHSYVYSADKEEERLNSISLSLNYLIPIKDL